MKNRGKAKVGAVVLGLGVMLLVLLPEAQGAIPQKVNFQGYLTNTTGVPIHGTVSMVFSIYNLSIGGTALWTETQNVPITNGVYTVNLGEVTPIPLAFDVPYYLGVTVGTDPEMTPRQALTSVGYAFRAQNADNGGGWIYGGNIISLGAGATNVGIGTATPSEKLEIAGNLKMNGDIKTDRWLNNDTNTLIGVGVVGAGQLTHTTGPDGRFNTALGYSALYSNATGYYNTATGANALPHNTTGYYNTAVGASAGYGNQTGSRNVFLGTEAGYNELGSDRLHIANCFTSTLIYGEFDTGSVCINCTDPQAALDVNGPLRVRAQSSLWISGNGARPFHQSDSTIIDMNTTGGARITRGATAGNKNVMLPITVTGPLFGQNVTITGLDIYWAGDTELDAISAVLLRRQTGVCATSACYVNILYDSADHTCDDAADPTGCTLHFNLTANNVLTADSGILYLTLELAFSGASSWIDLGGARLTLQHN